MKIGVRIRIECDKVTGEFLSKLTGIPWESLSENPNFEFSFEANLEPEGEGIVISEDKVKDDTEEGDVGLNHLESVAEEENHGIVETVSDEEESTEIAGVSEGVDEDAKSTEKVQKKRSYTKPEKNVSLDTVPEFRAIAARSADYAEFVEEVANWIDPNKHKGWLISVGRVIPLIEKDDFSWQDVKDKFQDSMKNYSFTAQVYVSRVVKEKGYALLTFVRAMRLYYFSDVFKPNRHPKNNKSLIGNSEGLAIIQRDSAYFQYVSSINKEDSLQEKAESVLRYLENPGNIKIRSRNDKLRIVKTYFEQEGVTLEDVLRGMEYAEDKILEEKVDIASMFDEYFRRNEPSMKFNLDAESILKILKAIVC